MGYKHCYIEYYIALICNIDTGKDKLFNDVRKLIHSVLKYHNIIDEIPYFITAMKYYPNYKDTLDKIQVLL